MFWNIFSDFYFLSDSIWTGQEMISQSSSSAVRVQSLCLGTDHLLKVLG